jgi:hypothetical protein
VATPGAAQDLCRIGTKKGHALLLTQAIDLTYNFFLRRFDWKSQNPACGRQGPSPIPNAAKADVHDPVPLAGRVFLFLRDKK